MGRLQLSWQRRLQIALDVATALSYLHGGRGGINACYHRDIKSANICLKGNFTAQLIDCGLAKFVREENVTAASSASRKVGTPGYICPLYLNDVITYSAECDVFSFGIVLFELIVGQVQNFKPDKEGKLSVVSPSPYHQLVILFMMSASTAMMSASRASLRYQHDLI